MPLESPRLGHQPALDGVRGGAVLAVLLYHTGVPLSTGGFIGVDVFFVLSGFLITVLLLEEWRDTDRVALTAFYQRRALRLLPALFAVVVAACTVGALLARGFARPTIHAVPFVVLYGANWARIAHVSLGLLEHTWSLSIEEQFYLIWPIVLLVLIRRRTRHLAGWLIGAACVLTAADAARWHFDLAPGAIYNGLEAHGGPLLLLGGATAVLFHTGALHRPAMRLVLARAAWPAAGVVIAGVMLLHTDHGFYSAGGLSVFGVGSAAVIATVTTTAGPLRSLLAWRPMTAIGRISYGLYLWHYPIYIVVRQHLAGRPGFVVYPCELAAAFLAAALSYRFVERPFLARKRRARPHTGAAHG